MDRPRNVIGGRKLAVVIRGWLRSTPERLWGKDPNYEKLKALKRQDGPPPDPRMEVSEYIASRLDELGWEVSYPEPGHPFNPPLLQRSEPSQPAEDRDGKAERD